MIRRGWGEATVVKGAKEGVNMGGGGDTEAEGIREEFCLTRAKEPDRG